MVAKRMENERMTTEALSTHCVPEGVLTVCQRLGEGVRPAWGGNKSG
jgi:hypothetical protein